jgi:hypothetical protein
MLPSQGMKFPLRLIIFASLTLPFLTIANADTIFSDLGPGNSHTDHGYTVSGSASVAGFNEVAMGFTPSGDFLLQQIDVAVEALTGTNSVVLTLNSDNGGLPGSVIMSWNISNLPPDDSSNANFVETVTPGSVINLAFGTQYWLVVAPGASDTLAGWDNSNSGESVIAYNIGDGYFTHTNESVAFDVLGNTVPEPASGLLAAVGMALLLFKFHNRRRPD